MPNVVNGACLPSDSERVDGVVIKVVDGDTIEVQIGRDQVKVRYLGIDTPETYPVVDPYGPQAKDRNRELVKGQRVILIRDPKADNEDRYGRLLRHVLVGETFVNYTLIQEGYASFYSSPQSCGAQFLQAQQNAQTQDLGMWAPPPETGGE